jgi:hypothetical protein
MINVFDSICLFLEDALMNIIYTQIANGILERAAKKVGLNSMQMSLLIIIGRLREVEGKRLQKFASRCVGNQNVKELVSQCLKRLLMLKAVRNREGEDRRERLWNLDDRTLYDASITAVKTERKRLLEKSADATKTGYALDQMEDAALDVVGCGLLFD